MKNEIPVVEEDNSRTHFGSGVNPISPAYYLNDGIYSKIYGFSKQGYINENGLLELTDIDTSPTNMLWNNKFILNGEANTGIRTE